MYPYEAWAEQNLNIIARYDKEFRIQCLSPNHEDPHPSAYFNVEIGVWYCHSCGARGTIVNDTSLYEHSFQVNVLRHRLQKINQEPDMPSFQDDLVLNRFKLPGNYWEELRGINKETQELFDLGYDPIANALTIPLRNIEGRLIGVTRRFLAADHIGPRYKYPKGFKASQNLFAAWLYDEYDMSTVSIHEGAIDSIRLWQLGIPAIATYGSSISEEQIDLMLKMGIKTVVWFGDSDKAGMRAKERAKGYWLRSDDTYQYKKNTDLSRYFLFYHITNHNNKKDAGAMTDTEILSSWKSKELFTFKGDIRRVHYNTDLRLRLRNI